MPFTFAARSILELGRELISSDEVALYELIKNAVDAGSDRVEIVADIQLLHKDFRSVVEYIEQTSGPCDAANRLRPLLRNSDLPEAAALLAELAVDDRPKSELATRLRRFYVKHNYIEVRDHGHGMSFDELGSVFLRIGTDSRRRDNRQGARHLGDKGIGRLSTMRLGDRLTVTTTKEGESHWNELRIDWSWFDSDGDADAADYEVGPEAGEAKDDPSHQGTVVRISGLHGDWDGPRFADILQGKIARMVDPFEPGIGNKLIIARHNGQRVRVRSIPRELLDAAHAVCCAEFAFDDGEPTLRGRVHYRLRHRQRRVDLTGPELLSVTQRISKRRAKRGHAAFKLDPLPLSALRELGGFRCEIYWYNRRVVEAVSGLTTKAAQTREHIANWSGGPMLYRYGFRVLPFGEPGDDWLELDKRAFGVSGFKLNRQQVIGRVRIDTPHDLLSEQTNRQGLIDSDASHALRMVLQYLVHVEFRNLINEADAEEKDAQRLANVDHQVLTKAHARAQAALKRIRQQYDIIPADEMDTVSAGVDRLTEIAQGFFDQIEKTRSEADRDRSQFIHLAGIGLMTEFIFHELDRAVNYALDNFARGGRGMPADVLRDQLITLQKRISAFDELSAERRQSKSRFDVASLIRDVLRGHREEFRRHAIEVVLDLPGGPVYTKAVRGMFIQILENLIVNSAYWLKRQKDFEPEFRPRLSVTLRATPMRLSVEDNGPGVSAERMEHIFQPFVTTKPVGMGRGLGLYIARDMAEYHGWQLGMDPELGRVRDGRSNKFTLEAETA